MKKKDSILWVFVTSKKQNEHSIWGLACSGSQNILFAYMCEGGMEMVFHNTSKEVQTVLWASTGVLILGNHVNWKDFQICC